MPCNGDYLNPSTREKNLSKVACLLDELDGKPMNLMFWSGYHPRVYGNYPNADEMVADLCKRLQKVDVSKYSLEMQIWWRDHQEADRQRIIKEQQTIKDEADRKAALDKLTAYEKKLLGLK